MNGLTHLEPDCSEFVEVDPTGRYGRVLTICLSLYISLRLMFHFLFWVIYFFIVFWLLQYNEILGKGASKTVYGSKFSAFIVFFVYPFEISSGFVHLELVLIALMDTRFRFF